MSVRAISKMGNPLTHAQVLRDVNGFKWFYDHCDPDEITVYRGRDPKTGATDFKTFPVSHFPGVFVEQYYKVVLFWGGYHEEQWQWFKGDADALVTSAIIAENTGGVTEFHVYLGDKWIGEGK